MLRKIIQLVFLSFAIPCFATSDSLQNLTKYVNPKIGTGYHGHTFIGANMPFGAVQLGPTNLTEGWDWCSGYHQSDSIIIGFQHTHLSGTGIGDLGDILVMPYTGKIKTSKGSLEQPGYFSKFKHDSEITEAGYYKVDLENYGIKVELTASERVGFHKYTFPKSDSAHIIFDMVPGIGWDNLKDSYIKIINDSTLVGYRFSQGWANDQRIFFTATFSKPFKSYSLWLDQNPASQPRVAQGPKAKAVLDFITEEEEVILVKVAISPVSSENAKLNMIAEIPHWDFKKTIENVKNAWNIELNKVQISSLNADQKVIFYTALYHTMIAPSLFNDVNKDYWGTDKQIHSNAKFDNYTTFSLWDTYRAASPLFTLLQPKRSSHFINSMLAIYEQQGHLPIWHLMGNETYTMPGISGVQVAVDAALKGIEGINPEAVFDAAMQTSLMNYQGLKFLKNGTYIPADSVLESVAYGLEYAISDASIALLAKKLNKKEYNYYAQRAKNYKSYFDPTTRFMRGRLTDTEWRTPFNPIESKHREDDFSEGNAWQYTWMVPHDVEGLIELMGGNKSFTQKLDSLFIIEGHMGENASNDITGLIGQYAHGNEPSHHISYLYSYAAQPHKTAEKVRHILKEMYHNTPEGIIGNEDAGQMSAWYIWSSIGMYPVHPTSGIYVFGSPALKEAKLNLENGNTVQIIAHNNSDENIYIQSAKWNGKKYTNNYIYHSELLKGGILEFEMGAKPSKTWGIKSGLPFSPK